VTCVSGHGIIFSSPLIKKKHGWEGYEGLVYIATTVPTRASIPYRSSLDLRTEKKLVNGN
jgi:hypothetical protein